MKKRFGFSLDQELHAKLKARAEREGVSMAAVCREALSTHLQKPALELPLPPRPSTTGPLWSRLKEGVSRFLSGDKPDNVFQEFDDLFAEPFQTDHTPDSPGRKRPQYPHNLAPRARMEDYDSRWLDELWA